VIARRALRPVGRLTAAAEHVAKTQDLGAPIEIERHDELGRLADSFNQMLAALGRSREQQHRLVVDASHELRTPLTSLRTNIELLDRATDLPEGERRELLGDAVAELEELSALVAELVDLATDVSQAGDQRVDLRLDEVVDRVVERARRRGAHSITLESEPTVVDANPILAERAVANLVDNARKWADERISVGVRSGTVTVGDDGPGIAEADLERVFDRFYRSPGNQDVPGSGLGLAIVRQIAEAHGGRAWAENDPGGGARVSIELPGEGLDLEGVTAPVPSSRPPE